MARYFFFIVLVLCGALPQVTRAAPLEDAAAARSEEAAVLDQLDDAAVARLDLYCLRMAYPQIKGFADDAEGPLAAAEGRPGACFTPRPWRPTRLLWGWRWRIPTPTPFGMWTCAAVWPSPTRWSRTGRKRPWASRRGGDVPTLSCARCTAKIKRPCAPGCRPRVFWGQGLQLAAPAARALRDVDARLALAVRQTSALRPLLKMDGGFTWRRIAGTSRLSPHAFGIALDISPGIATYWRWSPLRPHPLQKGYPSAIVAAFEDAGFIWGGKWHEYDLMHFEYRPELVWQGPRAAWRVQGSAAGRERILSGF